MSNIARVNSEGSVILNGGRVGRVERRESTGPRGGTIVEWVAHSPFVPAAVYRMRAAAADAVAIAWTAGNRADAYPSSAEPCPCGALFIDGVCDACDSCSGCDVCEVAGTVEAASADRGLAGAYADAVCAAVNANAVASLAGAIIGALGGRGYVAEVAPTGGGCDAIVIVAGGREWLVTDGAAGVPDGVPDADGNTAVLTGEDGECWTWASDDGATIGHAVADILDGSGDGEDDGERAYTRAMNAQPSRLGSVVATAVMGLQGVAVTYSPAGTVVTIHREGETGASRTRVKLFNDDAHTYAVAADGGGDYDALCSDDAPAIVEWVCNELGVLPAGPSVSVWEGGRFLREVAGDDARAALYGSLQFHSPDADAAIVGASEHAYAAGGWQAHSETFGADECVVCGDHIEYCAGHGGDGPSAVVGMLATRYPLRPYYAGEDDAVAGIESPDASEDARVRVRLDDDGELYRVRVTVGGVTVAEDWADADAWSLASVILSVAGIDARER